jgi:hypothetical protein
MLHSPLLQQLGQQTVAHINNTNTSTIKEMLDLTSAGMVTRAVMMTKITVKRPKYVTQ